MRTRRFGASNTWVRAASVAALVYPTVGITFAAPLHPSSSHAAVLAWRLAAWFVSAATFAIHLGYELLRLRSSPVRGAIHTSAAVGLGAFLLAVWVNVHAHWSTAAPLAPWALVLFPAVTGVPAFLVGLVALEVLGAIGRRRGWNREG